MKPLSLAHDQSGNVTIEFAMIASILFLIILGIADFGTAYGVKSSVVNAARAGAQLALVRHVGEDNVDTATQIALVSGDIKNAVLQVSNLKAQDVDVVLKCGCPGVTALSDCSTISCSSGARQTFVSVTVRKDYILGLSYPGLGKVLHFSNTNIVRLN